MLEVGNPNLTVAESRSHFSLWCLAKAPLLVGTDVTKSTGAIIDILANKVFFFFVLHNFNC